MRDDKKEIELTPGVDWQSKEAKPGAPFFGKGLKPALYWIAAFTAAHILFRYFL